MLLLNWCHSESEDFLLLLLFGDKCGYYGAAAINRRRGKKSLPENKATTCAAASFCRSSRWKPSDFISELPEKQRTLEKFHLQLMMIIVAPSNPPSPWSCVVLAGVCSWSGWSRREEEEDKPVPGCQLLLLNIQTHLWEPAAAAAHTLTSCISWFGRLPGPLACLRPLQDNGFASICQLSSSGLLFIHFI